MKLWRLWQNGVVFSVSFLHDFEDLQEKFLILVFCIENLQHLHTPFVPLLLKFDITIKFQKEVCKMADKKILYQTSWKRN